MSLSLEILEYFQTAGYVVFQKHFPVAESLDTIILQTALTDQSPDK